MAAPASKLPNLQTYAALKAAVLAVVQKGRGEIDRAWLMTYHETGRLIHEHLLLHQERAAYGAQVFAKLAEDTGTSSRSLHEFVQFYRLFPIVRGAAQLNWNHYRVLCQMPDPKTRDQLLKETVAKGWNSGQLEHRVRVLAPVKAGAVALAKDVTPPKLLTPKRGTLGMCRVVVAGAGLAVDLGFSCYLDLPDDAGHKVGDFLRADGADWVKAKGATKLDLFTYQAELLSVVDGDTLWVKVYLRPGQWVKQKLRLRDLDCPEMDTAEGREAKKFTAVQLAQAASLTISTTKPDKYDRYLSDIFIQPAEGEEIYLNNALLSAGHAERKDSYSPADWGE